MNFWQAIQVIVSNYPLQMLTSFISGVTCALIGCFIILRRMALIGDALAHAILPGVVIAFIIANHWPVLLTSTLLPLVLFGGAIITGILTSLLIGFIQEHSRAKEDSSIGIAFTFFFAIGVILISQLPRGTHFDLQCFLFGEPLAVEALDFWMMLAVGILVFATIVVFYRPFLAASFDPVMAVAIGINVTLVHYLMMILLSATVVAGLRAVGVIMVVAMLIAPGLTAYQLTNRLPSMLILAGCFGGLSAIGGYILAFWQNWPTGPAITVFAGSFFFLAMIFSPQYGMLGNYYRRFQHHRHILTEDILKSLARPYPTPLDLKSLQDYLCLPWPRLTRMVQKLERQGLLRLEGEVLRLTDAGKLRADEILRTHRLWEKYLAENGVDVAQVHDLAEVLEHAHEMATTLNQKLGTPDKDPHGREIPQLERK